MSDHIIDQGTCPSCNSQMDRATNIDGNDTKPDPGDVTFCIKCAAMLQFSKSLSLIEVTEEMLSDFPVNEQVYLLDIQEKLRQFVSKRPTIN